MVLDDPNSPNPVNPVNPVEGQGTPAPADLTLPSTPANHTNPFENHATRLKINPDTYIKFDGSDRVMMSNIHGETAMSLQSDILLILWDLVNWKTVGELVAPWPEEDQQKIIDYMDTFHQLRIIITDESEEAEQGESILSDKLGNKIHINVENHHVMLKDYVRLAAYRRAIERVVTPESVVLDLGCGTGILSFFAVQAGAKKVYAIEKRPDILQLAKTIAEDNGMADRIEFLEGASSTIKTNQLDPQPTVMISEILANGIMEENIMEFTMDARDRLLAPNATLCPHRLDICAFVYESQIKQDKAFEVDEFQDLYGINFSSLKEILCHKSSLGLDHYNPHLMNALSEPTIVHSIDLQSYDNSIFSKKIDLTTNRTGKVTGYCIFFKVWLDENTTLTNSPFAPKTHWTQMQYTLPTGVPVQEGDTLTFELVYDGNLRMRLT